MAKGKQSIARFIMAKRQKYMSKRQKKLDYAHVGI